jgi:hypothetical protein
LLRHSTLDSETKWLSGSQDDGQSYYYGNRHRD